MGRIVQNSPDVVKINIDGRFPARAFLFVDDRVRYVGKIFYRLKLIPAKFPKDPAVPAAFFQDNPFDFIIPCIVKQSA